MQRKRAVPAVTRAIAILRRLGGSDEPLGVQQIARDLDLVPSTCLHILRVLKDEGLVAFDPISKRYFIDVGILSIARSAIEKNAFASLIQPQLDKLTTRFGLTTIAVQLIEPSSMIVVALSQVPLPFRLQVDLGSRFPAMISATGRCFAAFNAPDEATLRKGFAALHWDNPPDFDVWREEVRQARELGYAVDVGNYISGVTVVAVPFFDSRNRMAHGMVAIGISERVATIGVPEVAKAMLALRDEVAPMLFAKSRG
ncbi:MAG: IclR family transcriptional regulator [Alphaproteobacteria bacterium]|nr:IclR family transcriptional regulator [Alphaproteobacteria bacterium]MDX5367879.1 IclR family transcriptional regulator [Alphaproteobacteria bacterium]MDX5462749.1 IclR family transcriptional regulator [Alphaproteobacteria bacterium]